MADLGTILVVDDSVVNLELISLVLRKNDYTVIPAKSGIEGYESAVNNRPELILLDIFMPDLDGFAVCKMLKENVKTRDIPVIFLTASNDKESIIEGFKLGAVDYLTKPFNKLELLARVKIQIQLQRTLRRVEESEQNYRLLFENMTNGFALHEIICDDNGMPIDYCFIQVNPAFLNLTGLMASNILGQSVKSVLPGTEDIWIQNYGKVALSGEPMYFDSFSSELDKYFDVIAFSPRIGYFATLFSDVTSKKLAEQKMMRYNEDLEAEVKLKTNELALALEKEENLTRELEESLFKERELGDLKTKFVSMASHEFKTPLTTIMTSCDILINFRNRYEEDKITEKLRSIKNEVSHMTKMIDSVLHMGRPLEKERLLFIEPVSLKLFLDSLATDLLLSDDYCHKIFVNIDDDIIIETDSVRLKMIVTNLLSNSIKYSPKNNSIVISSSIIGDILEMRFRDNGIGIPKDQLDKLFEPFHRFSNVGNIKGTGLGLSIIKREVEILGGNIEYNKEIIDGCEFIVKIPVKHKQ